jgi:hypothetical protein
MFAVPVIVEDRHKISDIRPIMLDAACAKYIMEGIF